MKPRTMSHNDHKPLDVIFPIYFVVALVTIFRLMKTIGILLVFCIGVV